MFDWEGCPIGLLDLYMEVGEVKTVDAGAGRVWIEVWIGDGLAKDHVRPECEIIRRRPIYGIMKQILKLCADKQACLIFMCDDTPSRRGNDTASWSGAIFLLLKELDKIGKLGHAVMFTRNTWEQILQRGGEPFPRETDREDCNGLYEMLDVLVTRQANRYSDPASGTVIVNNRACLSELCWLLPEASRGT